MKLEEIQILWDEDSKIDNTELARESLKVPDLYNTYLKIYSQERLVYVKINAEYYRTKKIKWEYYGGKSSAEVYAENPFELKVLRQDLDMYVKADDDMQKINFRREYQSQKIDFVERILKSLERRGFQIKNAIDWERMMGGPV
jgi:hypothetical protein